MRPATGVLPQALGRVAGKELLEFARESHLTTMQRSAPETRLRPNLYPDQTSTTFVHAESASPAVARNELLPVEGLLVTPKHIEYCAGWFFPAKLIIHMTFPRRRMARHEIEIKRCRPTESTVTRHKNGFVSCLWHGGEIIPPIFLRGRERAQSENFPPARQGKLIVFGRADAQSEFRIVIVQT